MRIMEDPDAENEADRLSQGVTSTTPEEIMREMGGRLGADFSDVQFHSDSASIIRSRAREAGSPISYAASASGSVSAPYMQISG